MMTFKNRLTLVLGLCFAQSMMLGEQLQEVLNALHLNRQPISYRVFDDQDPRAFSIFAQQSLISGLQDGTAPTIPVLYLFSHGLGNSHMAARRYATLCDLQPFVSFNYPDACIIKRSMDPAQTGLAQFHDVERLQMMFRESIPLLEKYKTQHAKLVVFGVSRGAATIASWLGSLEKRDADAIGALVLESPFDSVHTLIDHHVDKLGIAWMPNIHSLAHKLIARAFGKYSPIGTQPIDSIKKCTSKDIPLLIICSQQDLLVPWHSSVALYLELKKQGFSNVHLLYLSDGGAHSHMLDGPQAELYKNVLHAFFKRYGLPHSSDMAVQGEAHFRRYCQPEMADLQHLLEAKSKATKNRIEYCKYLINAIKRARNRRAQAQNANLLEPMSLELL